MSIALLATGNEIIEGDILNTNSREIAQILASEGLLQGMHLEVGDREEDIFQGLQFLTENHEVVLITGGLGPTSDDRTRFALGRFLGLPLLEFPEAIDHLQHILRDASLALSESNRQQALFPEMAKLMPNLLGTAMGCYCMQGEKLLALLPGPPRECLPMFHHYILPLLQQQHTLLSGHRLLKWRLFGVAEAEIGQILDDALQGLDCATGYRLEMPYLEFKVWCAPLLVDAVEAIVNPLVQAYEIASIHKKASERLYDCIKSQKKRIAIQDEVTGGVLESLILKPETWPLLKFHDTGNCELVFHLQGLQEYWSAEKGTSCEFSIRFQKEGSQEFIEEKHRIPFRSANVVHYASEWISFRLAALIGEQGRGH